MVDRDTRLSNEGGFSGPSVYEAEVKVNVREWLEQKDTWVPGVPSVPITTDYQELVHSIPLTDPPVLLVLLVHLVQME